MRMKKGIFDTLSGKKIVKMASTVLITLFLCSGFANVAAAETNNDPVPSFY